MSLLLYIVIFCLLGGVVSLVGGVLMLSKKTTISKHISSMAAFAAGVLISISILDLMPEAFELGEPDMVAMGILIGVVGLFVLEKMSVWFHHHHEPHGHAPEIVGVFLGDTLHNFIDGIAIGAAFLISVPAGIAAAIGVGMHELPQEIADFGLYIKSGMKKKKILIWNLASSLATLVGGVGIYLAGDVLEGLEVYILALTAGMFLYISLADLVPELHEEERGKKNSKQLVIFFSGIFVAYLSMTFLGH